MASKFQEFKKFKKLVKNLSIMKTRFNPSAIYIEVGTTGPLLKNQYFILM